MMAKLIVRMGWIALVLCLGGVAHANLSAPWVAGDPVSEPEGVFKNIHILSEDLSFDFRSPKPGKSVKIRAQYHIVQRGGAATVDLFFVAPGLQKGKVTFDGKPLKGTLEKRKIPSKWRDGHRAVSEGLRFQVAIAPGKHTIDVTYQAKVMEHIRATPVRVYGVNYVLAPARRWASFGTLRVSAKLPAGWGMWRNKLGLKPTGNGEWRGTFSKLPGDVVGVFAKPPVGWLAYKSVIFVFLFVLTFLVMVWIARWSGAWVFAKADARSRTLRGLVSTLGVTALLVAINWGITMGMFQLIYSYPHVARGDYSNLIWVLLGELVFPVLILCTSIAVLVWQKKKLA